MGPSGERVSWDSSWEEFHQSRSPDKYPYEAVIRFMARNYYSCQSNTSVLDLGCGGGNHLWYLAREGFNATGIDGSQTAVNAAQSYTHDCQPSPNLCVGDLIQLPFDDEAFDVAIDRQSIQHNRLKNAHEIASELYRVLKPGGQFLSVLVSNRSAEAIEREKFGGREIAPNTVTGFDNGTFVNAGITHFYTESEIYELFDEFIIQRIDHTIRLEDKRSDNPTTFAEWHVVGKKPPKHGN